MTASGRLPAGIIHPLCSLACNPCCTAENLKTAPRIRLENILRMSGEIIFSGSSRMPRVPLYKPNATYTGKTRPMYYEALKELIKSKAITRTEFNDAITDMDIEQAKVDRRREQRLAAAQREKERRAHLEFLASRNAIERATEAEHAAFMARRQAREAAKAAKAVLASASFAKGASADEEGWEFMNTLMPFAGRKVLITVRSKAAGAQLSVELTLPETKAKLHRLLRKMVFVQQGSSDDMSIFNVDSEGNPLPAGDVITINVSPAPEPVMAIRLEGQRFRDSATEHCVCAPLERMWEQYLENAETPASKKKLSLILERIRGFAEKYPHGIPEGEPMEELAKAINHKIVIKVLLSSESHVFNEKCTHGTLVFHNVRENHVEFGGKARSHITLASNPTIVSQEELSAIVADHIRQDEFVLFSGMEGKERRVYSARGAWAVEDKKAEIMEEHEKANHLKDIGVNAREYPELNEYLRDGRHNVGSPIKLTDGEPEAEVDMSKAYTQAEKCKYFRGYAGMVWGYGKLPEMEEAEAKKYLEDTIGFFTVEIQNNPDAVSSRFGLTTGKTLTLFSPLVLYLMAQGATVKLLSCVICNRIESLTYSEEMLKSKAYAPWAGRLSYDAEATEFNCTATRRFAEHLKANGHNIKWRWTNGEGEHAQGIATLLLPRKHRMTRHQLFGSICAYTQMNVMEAVRCFDVEGRLDDVKFATLDSILYSGELAAGVSSLFRKKGEWSPPPFTDEAERELGKYLYTNDWYDCTPSSDAWMKTLENPRMLTPTVLAGQGGCGKTYYAMTAGVLYNPLFCSPLKKLCQSVLETYGIRSETINKLIGIACVPLHMEECHPPVVFLDEITMIPAEWIERAVKMYPRTLFLLGGDCAVQEGAMVSYQCRNGKPGHFDELFDATGWNWMHFTTDRRSLDETLKEAKLFLRQAMDEVRTDGDIEDARELAVIVRDSYPSITVEEAIPLFKNNEDIWIAGTNLTNDRLAKRKIQSAGTDKKGDKRASFTTHSIQGRTVETGRVFISIDDSFELAMLYTAVSRVRRWEQVVFVRGQVADIE